MSCCTGSVGRPRGEVAHLFSNLFPVRRASFRTSLKRSRPNCGSAAAMLEYLPYVVAGMKLWLTSLHDNNNKVSCKFEV